MTDKETDSELRNVGKITELLSRRARAITPPPTLNSKFHPKPPPAPAAKPGSGTESKAGRWSV